MMCAFLVMEGLGVWCSCVFLSIAVRKGTNKKTGEVSAVKIIDKKYAFVGSGYSLAS